MPAELPWSGGLCAKTSGCGAGRRRVCRDLRGHAGGAALVGRPCAKTSGCGAGRQRVSRDLRGHAGRAALVGRPCAKTSGCGAGRRRVCRDLRGHAGGAALAALRKNLRLWRRRPASEPRSARSCRQSCLGRAALRKNPGCGAGRQRVSRDLHRHPRRADLTGGPLRKNLRLWRRPPTSEPRSASSSPQSWLDGRPFAQKPQAAATAANECAAICISMPAELP